jgi:hypothetical protein
MFPSLSYLSIYILIYLYNIDLIEIAIKSGYTSLELGLVRSLLSTIINYIAIKCVFLGVLYLLILYISLYSLVNYC